MFGPFFFSINKNFFFVGGFSLGNQKNKNFVFVDDEKKMEGWILFDFNNDDDHDDDDEENEGSDLKKILKKNRLPI